MKTNELFEDLRRLEKEYESKGARDQTSTTSFPSIAVLPFVDMSPQKDQEYFCEGMAEELINALTKIEKLQVASRTSAFQFKEKGYDIYEVGKKLKVQTILEGSVRKAGNRLRITPQLVNVEDGYHLWSEKYDRDMEDIFEIQDEISLAIVDKLKVKLFGKEKTTLLKRQTNNLETFNLFRKGRYFLNRRDAGDMTKALQCFERAIEKDKNYVFPLVGIADTYSSIGVYGIIPPKEAFSKAKTAANRALEIDDRLSEAHASLAWILTVYDWDWLSAEKEYKRAIELNPNYATAHQWYALYLAINGRFDEAIVEAKRALELDPLSVINNASYGLVFYYSRHFDTAIEIFRKTLEVDQNLLIAHLWKGLALIEKAMYEEAIESFEKAVTIGGGMIYALGLL